MNTTDIPDNQTAHDQFWASVEDPAESTHLIDSTDAYAAFAAAAEL